MANSNIQNNNNHGDSDQVKSEELVAQRYSELQDKMMSCYEEFREARHLQINVIAACGGLLGILTGASVLGIDSKQYEINIPDFLRNVTNNNSIKGIIKTLLVSFTPRRILFWIVSLAFCVTFLYVAKIGIENVLRYFYIRNLSIRAHDYDEMEQMKDVDNRGRLLVFSEFASPILTSSPAHIGSLHTLLHFVCNYASIGISILFCLTLVTLQYLLIYERNIFDRILYISIFLIIIGTMGLYIYMAFHAEDVVQYAWDESHYNHNNWHEGKSVKKDPEKFFRTSRQFRRVLAYYIYPRKNSIPSAILMIAGYVFGCFQFGLKVRLEFLFLVWMVFDFCFYQIRYMINDIRGLEEDICEYNQLFNKDAIIDDKRNHMRSKRKLGALLEQEMRLWEDIQKNLEEFKEKKLTPEQWVQKKDDAKKDIYGKFIKYTKMAIFLRLAFVLLIVGIFDRLRAHVFYVISLGLLILILTIVYEFMKAKESDNKTPIIIVAALGFPFRFIVGMSTIGISDNLEYSDMSGLSTAIITVISLIILIFGCYVIQMLWYRQMARRYIIRSKSGANIKYESIEKCDFGRGKYNYIKRYVTKGNIEILNKTDEITQEDLWKITGNEKQAKSNKPWNSLFLITVCITLICLIYMYIMDSQPAFNLYSIIIVITFLISNVILICNNYRIKIKKPFIKTTVIAIACTCQMFLILLNGSNVRLSILACTFYLINIETYTLLRCVDLEFISRIRKGFVSLRHKIDICICGDFAHQYTCTLDTERYEKGELI